MYPALQPSPLTDSVAASRWTASLELFELPEDTVGHLELIMSNLSVSVILRSNPPCAGWSQGQRAASWCGTSPPLHPFPLDMVAGAQIGNDEELFDALSSNADASLELRLTLSRPSSPSSDSSWVVSARRKRVQLLNASASDHVLLAQPALPCPARVQGYLAHQKHPPCRTLQ